MNYLSVKDAARLAGKHPNRILQLVKSGIIRAKKIDTPTNRYGYVWGINRQSLLKYKTKTKDEKRGRPRSRPRKEK